MSNNKDSHTWVVVVVVVLVGLALGFWVFTRAQQKAFDAKFDQTVTYHIDPDSDKTLDERGYSVTDLKMNQETGFYSWRETLKYSGTLDKSVDTKYDTTNEVTIVKDLKETDTNPRVEHQVVYKLNREAISKNKENYPQNAECVTGNKRESYIYSTCKGWNTESVRFAKHHYIIHIPENSDPANYK